MNHKHDEFWERTLKSIKRFMENGIILKEEEEEVLRIAKECRMAGMSKTDVLMEIMRRMPQIAQREENFNQRR